MINKAIVAGFFALFGTALPMFAAPPASCGVLNAGLQILSNVPVPTGGSSYSGGLKMAVWYPTSAATSIYHYPGISGYVALNGPAATCGHFPLIIFSHGWSGCGTQSVFLTEQLARLGYIVAAPDHNDHGCSVDGATSGGMSQALSAFPFIQFGNPGTWTDQTGLYRDIDVEAVLNYMLNTWSGRAVINPSQIVMAGHSFGGYTAFGKIGGWASWLNPKFKAAILYSPYIQAFQAQNPQTMSAPTVPQLFMSGGPQDKAIQPWIVGPQPCSSLALATCGEAGAFEQSAGTKYYGELAGSGEEAGHYAFTNFICTDFGAFTVQSCLTSVPNAQTIVNYTQDFLEHTLFGTAPRLLWGAGTEWVNYWRTSAVSPVTLKDADNGFAVGDSVRLLGEGMTSDQTTSVVVTDSTGTARRATIISAAQQEIQIAVPAGTTPGPTIISVVIGGKIAAKGPLTVKASGSGKAVMWNASR